MNLGRDVEQNIVETDVCELIAWVVLLNVWLSWSRFTYETCMYQQFGQPWRQRPLSERILVYMSPHTIKQLILLLNISNIEHEMSQAFPFQLALLILHFKIDFPLFLIFIIFGS